MFNTGQLFLVFFGIPSVVVSFDEIKFLQQYGYIPEGSYPSSIRIDSNNAQVGNDMVSEGLRTFQKAYGLGQTGFLDEETAKAMREPRCGRPDIESGERKKRATLTLRWEKKHLTYRIADWSRHLSAGHAEHIMHKAVQQWMNVTHFTITRGAKPDVEIRFGVGRHNCSTPFSSSILAHTFPPDDGRMHFNDEHEFKDTEISDYRGYSLYSVAIHEWGHALGLDHNLDEPNSIMSPRELNRKGVITERDKAKLKMLYYDIDKNERAPVTPVAPRPPNRPPPPTSPPRTTPKVPQVEDERPDPCTSGADAVGSFRGEYLFFKGSWMWRYSYEGQLIGSPEKISFLIPQIPYPADAAVEVDDDLWIFSGQKVFILNVGNSRRGEWLSLTRTPLTFADIDLPPYLTRVRLAYQWHYFNPPAIYLWGENEYWKLNVSAKKVHPRPIYPRSIKFNWGRVPQGAQAAFNRDKELHFLVDSLVYRMNTSDYRLPISYGYPVNISQYWQGCLPPARRSPSVLPPTRYRRLENGVLRRIELLWITVAVLILGS